MKVNRELVQHIHEICEIKHKLIMNAPRLGIRLDGYRDAIEAGDMFLDDERNEDLIFKLVELRKSCFYSDSEVAALGFALEELGLI